MSLEMGIWRIDRGLQAIQPEPLAQESRLEELLRQRISILEPDLMVVGSQVATPHQGRLDILAIDSEANPVAVELKRDKTPREVVAQALDYGSWVVGLTRDNLAEIYRANFKDASLDEAFKSQFGYDLPDEVNLRHRLIIVAASLDPSSERIVDYLTTHHEVPINAAFFRYFRDDGREYLARTWFVEPSDDEARPRSVKIEPVGENEWMTNDFFVSFGEGPHRSWDDARKYGFVSGGHGVWYHRTLKLLSPGNRVFVHIPKVGYVGVGRVTGGVKPVKEFTVEENGLAVPITKVPLMAPGMLNDADSPELSEYVVRVEWEQTYEPTAAKWEKGLFANQNTVCYLRRKHLDKLVRVFGLPA